MFIRTGHASLTDLELIDKFKNESDSNALGELFSRYSQLVYGVCLKYLKDRDEAKDAVMQIFEKLNKTLKEHSIEYFKGWLYTTSRNHCLMQIRSKKGVKTEEITETIMESEFTLHLEDETLPDENLSKLEKCIEELRSEQKTCVTLFYLKEKCYQEIADETGFEMKLVKSQIQNGKRNLKICMERSE